MDRLLLQFGKEYYSKSFFKNESTSDIINVLKNKTLISSEIIKLLKPYLNNGKEFDNFLKLIVGNTINLHSLFNDESLKELEISKVKFSDSNSEDQIENLREQLDYGIELIEGAYEIYKAVILYQLLSDHSGNKYNSLSEARISIYDKHANDLKRLKYYVRMFDAQFNGSVNSFV